jgi:hypothetical protein
MKFLHGHGVNSLLCKHRRIVVGGMQSLPEPVTAAAASMLTHLATNRHACNARVQTADRSDQQCMFVSQHVCKHQRYR